MFWSVCKPWRGPNEPFASAHTRSLKFTGRCLLFIGSTLDLACGSQNDCSHIAAILDLSLLLLLFSCNVFWGLPTFTSLSSIALWVAFFSPFWQQSKSHVWVSLSGRHDEHFTETRLCCHFFFSFQFYFHPDWTGVLMMPIRGEIISSAFVSVEIMVHFPTEANQSIGSSCFFGVFFFK